MDIQTVCPFCGGLLGKGFQGSFMSDSSLFPSEDLLLTGCLCFFSFSELKQMLTLFERRLLKTIETQLEMEDRTMDEVVREVSKIPKGSPLRASIMYRLGVLDRVKKFIEDRTSIILEAKKKEEQLSQDRDIGIRGERLGLMSWISSFKENE